jgi:3-dehydroquinate dehydratase-1
MNFDDFVLAASTATLEDEPAAREHADAVEFRLDLAAEPRAQLDTYEGELPLIATNRASWEGGEASDDEARLDALADVVAHPAVEAVDVELAAMEDGSTTRVVDAAERAGVKTIVSAHDFDATPDRAALVDTLQRACEYGDIGKLAVTAQDRGDALAILAATHELTAEGNTVATMGMGEPGRHTRAVAPLYGSKIGYAPVHSEDATAPGQYDLGTLRSLVDSLQSR